MKQTAQAFSFFLCGLSALISMSVHTDSWRQQNNSVCISLPLTRTNCSVFPGSHVSLMGIYLLISKQRVFFKALPPGCHIKTT